MPTVVEGPGTEAMDAFLDSRDGGLMVSDFAAAEVASGISRLIRVAIITPDNANVRLAAFDAWRAASAETLDLIAADARMANLFVRRFELALRTPDALHAAICQRTGCSLVTLDRRLARAAASLGVTVVVPVA